LGQIGIKKLDKLDDDFRDHFNEWAHSNPLKINYDHTTEDIIANMMKLSIAHIGKDNSCDHLTDPLLILYAK